MKDFVPLTLLASFPLVFIASPTLPAKTLQELVAFAKQNPGKINYASPGPGSPQHIGMERLMAETGIQMTHVPYRGGDRKSVGEGKRVYGRVDLGGRR